MKRSRRTLTPMEDPIQISIVQLLMFKAHRLTIWHAVPNGIPCSKRTGARFVRLGLVAGVGDFIIIPPPDGRAHYLEVKTTIGTLSEAQRAFRSRCEEAGIPYAIARSSREAEAILSEWGALQPAREEVRRMAA